MGGLVIYGQTVAPIGGPFVYEQITTPMLSSLIWLSYNPNMITAKIGVPGACVCSGPLHRNHTVGAGG